MYAIASFMRNGCFVLALGIGLAWGAAAQADGYLLLRLGGQVVKWGKPALETGAAVTYGFVRSELAIPGAINCKRLEPLAPYLERKGVSLVMLRREVDQAFRMWERAADIDFSYVEDPATADILIGADGARRGIAFANVWRGSVGQGSVSSIARAAICLNPLVPWEVAFDGSAETFDVRRVAAHEIGHALGLDHPGLSGELMGFSYEESDRTLRPGDIAGARALYGPPPSSRARSVPE